jgi:hypothetical protein
MAICPELRERVLETYRLMGGDYHRWMPVDQEKMAIAITKVEDQIESERKNQEHRGVLKPIRRSLEDELDR